MMTLQMMAELALGTTQSTEQSVRTTSKGAPKVNDSPAGVGAEKPGHWRAQDDSEAELSGWEIAALLIRKRGLAFSVWGAILLIGTALVLLLTKTPEYSATASFYPQSAAAASGSPFVGLAAQYGLPVASGGGAESPQFYAELLESRRLLSTIVSLPYDLTSAGGTTELTLVEYFADDKESIRSGQEEAIRKLRSRLDVHVNAQIGVVEFTVIMPQPNLAQEIAAQIIRAVNEFNVSNRQNNAASERTFVEARLTDARSELAGAEASLEAFLRQNRQFQNSPELTFQYERLQRDVVLKQTSVTSLSQALEQARIEEVRNLPVISVFEEPTVPVRPDPSGRLWLVLAVVTFASLAAIIVAFTSALIERAKRGTSHYGEFRRALAEAKDDPLPVLRRSVEN